MLGARKSYRARWSDVVAYMEAQKFEPTRANNCSQGSDVDPLDALVASGAVRETVQ